jgi:bifunctional pyridoxal-dependent enzyme with beta-cystathionase and maltose regulon repressor activities
LHYSTIHGANVLSQIAATTALNKCEYWLNDFLKHLTAMKDKAVNELNSIPNFKCIAPQGCYVAFTNISNTNKSSQEMQEFLLNRAKVAVVPGLKQWFGDGAEGYIRMSFATSDEILSEALYRIKLALK